MVGRPALDMFDKILIEMRGEGGSKGAGGPRRCSTGGSGGRVGGVATAGGDVVGTGGGTPVTSLALDGAWRGGRGVMAMVFISWLGLLRCGLGKSRVLYHWCAHFWMRDDGRCAEEGFSIGLWRADPGRDVGPGR